MSKVSIRKQLEAARAQVADAKSKDQLSPEALTLINTLLTLLEVMATVFLEKKVRKNSSNSGLPPSQGFGSNGNRNKDGHPRPLRKGSRLDNTREEEEKKTLSPEKCSECGMDIEKANAVSTEERTILDIEYVIKKTTFVSEVKECPFCKNKTTDVPKEWIE